MVDLVNFIMQKANALLTVCLKYAAGPDVDGISSDDIQSLQSATDDVAAKNTAQEKAVETEQKLTSLLDDTLAKGHALIRKAQNAAQAHYGKDNRARNQEFHIGGKDIRTVKAMGDELGYMKSAVTDNKDDLAKHGFKDTDIASFDSVSQELKTNSGNQKDAQKVKKAATKERDASVKNLQAVIRSIQKTAKVVFADKPSVLIEFESIREGRHGTKTQPPTPQPTSQTK